MGGFRIGGGDYAKPYEQITLCRHCAEDYRAAGYDLIIDKTVDVMDWCELCGRRAWTYLIWRDNGGESMGKTVLFK